VFGAMLGARTRSLRRSQLLEVHDKENVRTYRVVPSSSKTTVLLQRAFCAWVEYVRFVQIAEIRELTAAFHYDVRLCQRAFLAWKLFVMDSLWKFAVELWSYNLRKRVFVCFRRVCTMERRQRIQHIAEIGAKRAHRKKQLMLERLQENASQNRTDRRNSRILLETMMMSYFSKWRLKAKLRRNSVFLQIFLRIAWSKLRSPLKIRKGMERLSNLRKTTQYRLRVCANALGIWKAFVTKKRLSCFYGEIGHVLREMRTIQARKMIFGAERKLCRFKLMFAFKVFRKRLEDVAFLEEVERRLIDKVAADAKRRHFLRWRMKRKSCVAMKCWKRLVIAAQKELKRIQMKIDSAKTDLLFQKTSRVFREWKKVAWASNHFKQQVLKATWRKWSKYCATCRFYVRLAESVASKRRTRCDFLKWKAFAKESVAKRIADEFWRDNKLSLYFARWKRFLEQQYAIGAHRRLEMHKKNQGWFSEIRTHAARTFRDKKFTNL